MKKTFNQLSQSGVYKEDDIAVTLTVCGGTYGGGREVLVVERKSVSSNQSVFVFEGNGQRQSHRGDGYKESETMYTLNTVEQHGVAVIENHPNDSRVKIKDGGIVQALTSRMGTGGGNTPMVMETRAEAVDVRNGTTNGTTNGTLQRCASNNLNGNNVVMETGGDCKPLGRDRAAYNQGRNAQFNFSVEENKIGAQTAKGPGAVCTSVVRRITPLEAERLQGFPCNWTRIGTPKTFTVNDYVYGFDYVKFEQIKPDINDYVPLEKQGEYELPEPPSEADLLDEDYFDDDDPDYESVYDDDEDWIAYRKAYDEARKKSEKRVKVEL